MRSNRLYWLFIILLLAGCAGGNKILVSGTTFSGEVLSEKTETPLEGVTIHVVKNEKVVQETLTDRNGGFIFHDLPSGGFELTASKGEDWEPMSPRSFQAEKFKNGNYYDQFYLTPRATRLVGQVLTEVEGKRVPVQGVEVSTYPPTVEARTDETGQYEIASDTFKPNILYAVQVRGEDYNPEMVRVENLQLTRANPVPDIILKLQVAVTDTSIAKKRNIEVVRDVTGEVIRIKQGVEDMPETRGKPGGTKSR